MNVAVGLLTVARPWLLKTTLHTLRKTVHPFRLCVMDNGSMDEQTQELIVQARPDHRVYRNAVPVGQAWNELVSMCMAWAPDLIVLTADDYQYIDDWLDRLVAWWEEAPPDVAITSMNWEPMYPWNGIVERVTYGKQNGLIRQTVPGSSWSFRSSMWAQIGPLEPVTGGEDGQACRKLTAAGFRLAALDLSDHIGERQSAWGNNSWKIGKPLDEHTA